MKLKQKIHSDLIAAIKKKDQLKCSVLRMLSAVISNAEKEKRYKIAKAQPELEEKELAAKSQLIDPEIVEIIFSEAKKRRESILEFEKGGREDLAKKEKAELEILKQYLPEQLTEQEIEKLIQQAIEKVGASEIKDMPKVMTELMPKVKGRAEGSLVAKLVKERLTASPEK